LREEHRCEGEDAAERHLVSEGVTEDSAAIDASSTS
jgi:hypothetical protein